LCRTSANDPSCWLATATAGGTPIPYNRCLGTTRAAQLYKE
jgi:hypothetical protein